ncbi:PAS domain-containing protein [Rhodocytophaga rosea]|uniref:histidine kinase n=1 Tax=Rhodocytophaga rosea TaxID=2704465 RepID=A0A6C0GUS6_9BACT|nr:PAS domain-containing protein [Rhodocytophaga rosea]QHT71090.1 PAS domain-containing protein [Rhodocytophaga rosea]
MDAEIFFQLSPLAQCCLTPDLLLVKWNDAFEQLAGIPVWANDPLQKFIPAKALKEVHALITSLNNGETKELTFALRTNTVKTAPITWKTHLNQDNLLYFIQLQNQPGPKAKETKETAKKAPSISLDSLTSMVNQSGDLISRFDKQLRFTFVNQELLRQAKKLTTGQFLGKTTKEMAPLLGISQENFTQWTNDLQQVLDTGKEVMHHNHVNLPTHTVHFQTMMFPDYSDGAISGVLVITRIINELKNTEVKLREQKNLLKLVFDCMQEGVMVIDLEKNFVLSNKTARTAIPIDLSTKNYEEWAQQVESFYPDKKTILPPEEIPVIKALSGETVFDHLGYYKHKKTKEGVFIIMNASPLTDASGKLIGAVAVFNNVSDRIKTQEQIASSLATLQGIIESTQDMVVAIDKNYSILAINSPGRKSFANVAGKLIDKDSNLIEVLANRPDLAEGVKLSWYRALQGETYMMMHEAEMGSNDTRYFESVYSPMYDAKGSVIGATMVGREVTEKLEQESEIKELVNRLMKLNQQFEEKNKALLAGEEELSAANEELKTQQEELQHTVDELAARNFELDQLVYKMSHDIRSPLTSVLGLTNVMKVDPDQSQWPVYINHIENRVLTLDRFVQSMISYAKANRNVTEAQLIDFGALLEQSKHDLAYMKGFDSIDITLEYKGENSAFYGDLFRLKILFNNIVSNAIKYQNPYAESHYLQVLVDQTPKQAVLTFTDNGIGIKEDHIAKIFDMFYRATEHTDGSGLGLYIVKQTVEKMKGKISLESQYGKMTKFIVVLPNMEKA